MPEPLRSHARQGVLNGNRAAQTHNVLCCVWASNSLPTRICFPVRRKFRSIVAIAGLMAIAGMFAIAIPIAVHSMFTAHPYLFLPSYLDNLPSTHIGCPYINTFLDESIT